MSEQPLPYLRSCPVCGDGQLQLHRCGRCDAVVAICDECELIWRDAAEASRSAEPKSDAAFPACPACGAQRVKWFRLDRGEIRAAGLEAYMADGTD
ncbi:MAG: hypothetical protein MUF25_15645 [Pirellulaceae bacterium]|jgi:hypothetical protein|nr:hypothetical protein [Pirellulaceae bacterium]